MIAHLGFHWIKLRLAAIDLALHSIVRYSSTNQLGSGWPPARRLAQFESVEIRRANPTAVDSTAYYETTVSRLARLIEGVVTATKVKPLRFMHRLWQH